VEKEKEIEEKKEEPRFKLNQKQIPG